jgi:site-specific DNA-methyltransferase (adenine-specific)
MERYPDKYFDLAIVDPPYGGGHVQNNHKTPGVIDKYRKKKRFTLPAATLPNMRGGTWFAKYGQDINDWDVAPPPEYFKELARISRRRIIWGGNYFDLPPSRNFIIWRKLTISEGFSMAMSEYAWTDIPGNAKVFDCRPQDKHRFHPTQKPEALYKWLLSRYAESGWQILDTHLGSGSIAIACIDLGYDLTACELDKVYFEKAMERIEEHQKQGLLFPPGREQGLF